MYLPVEWRLASKRTTKVMRFGRALLIPLLFVISWSTLAQANAGVQDPQGEQPDFEKKYRPTIVEVNWIFELNPLLLLNRGLALELEKRFGEIFTLGLDLHYQDAELFRKESAESGQDVVGEVQSFGVSPKFRLYPLPSLAGIFFGAKVFVGYHAAHVESGDVSKTFDQMLLAPVAHVGYRITGLSGFTFSLYIGGGVNIPELEIESSALPAEVRQDASWLEITDQLKQHQSTFRPDFGLTLGLAL